MKAVIVGNGIIALTTALELSRKDPLLDIVIAGPSDRKGCASLAAAAMFNSYCELEPGVLENETERQKWLLNQSANALWPDYIKRLQQESDEKINHGFGTYLINNHTADFIEDENFNAVCNGLDQFKEPYQYIDPKEIPHYNPYAKARASRAIFIPNEGWINPFDLINAIAVILKKNPKISFSDVMVKSLNHSSGKITEAITEDGNAIGGDVFFLANGANFSKLINASGLGIDLPRIFYGVGCTVILKTDQNTLSNCIRTPNRGLACGTYSAPQESDKTVIGASNNIMPWPEDNARVTSVYTLLKNAMEQINSDYYRAQLLKVSLGWRPTSEDTIPLIGGCSYPNLFIATGTKRDGLHCSPVISDYISDLILEGKGDSKYDLFRPERKPIRVYSRKESIDKYVKHTIDAHFQHDFEPSKDGVLISLEAYYRNEAEKLHDQVGAQDWGIPVELYNMYKYGHAR